ncbi:hypothetical protein [Mycobacterium sp. 236(2023)]|uniref:hypothetical protein n=1 Tax=Mycobacterium sp. 236(2023) TaxID=3038163 RepID=UPI002414FB32|nr:hypothetical protein [Mycobacterium sp. 236(2023)]MDG4664187.1 hypothetical protein [Mycobacterium sp. 236(2023)]
MSNIIIGTEAIANGVVTRHELCRHYQPIFRNVHAPRVQSLTVRDRAIGAWLYSQRVAVISGLAAAALHGAQWIDDTVDIELVYKCPRPPGGIIARNERIAADEWQDLDGLPLASPARTAFDLGRYRPDYDAMARLDALMAARPYSIEDVLVLTKRYKGARGVARLKAVLPFVDGGAQSPRESWWRKLVIDSGFPIPQTQIPVVDEHGKHIRTVDFGWDGYQVAFEYDGGQHQSDRKQYLLDRYAIPALRRRGWAVSVVVKEDDPIHVIEELKAAMYARGWRGAVQIPRYAYSSRRRAEIASRQGKCE